MDFTALRYFNETANSRSIRAASERLHVSPSAISRKIAKLEHELKAPVFDRRAQGMKLTVAGQMLQAKVEAMMREFARIKSHITALQNLHSGTIDLFCFQTAIESFLAPMLNQFNLNYPNVLFNVTMSSTDEAIEALIKGVAEIGLVVNPPARDGLVSIEIFRDSIVVVASPDHPLAKSSAVSLAELATFLLVLTAASFGLRQQIDRAFERQSIDPTIFCTTNSLSLAKSIASFEGQCTLLPRSAAAREAAAGTLSTIPVTELMDAQMVFAISMLDSRSVTPAAKVFVDDAVGTHNVRSGISSRCSVLVRLRGRLLPARRRSVPASPLPVRRTPGLRCFAPAIILRPGTCWPASDRITPC